MDRFCTFPNCPPLNLIVFNLGVVSRDYSALVHPFSDSPEIEHRSNQRSEGHQVGVLVARWSISDCLPILPISDGSNPISDGLNLTPGARKRAPLLPYYRPNRLPRP